MASQMALVCVPYSAIRASRKSQIGITQSRILIRDILEKDARVLDEVITRHRTQAPHAKAVMDEINPPAGDDQPGQQRDNR